MNLHQPLSGEDLGLRKFAIAVVRTLREAGYQAMWAGGCVRDQLRGVAAKDYDVATNATPDQVQNTFGRRRTIAVGKQFGVVVVRSAKRTHQIEVATFRRDLEYTDGRRPTAVEFTSAEEDARRRDFTINGLFFDPLENRIIDYVDGQADLRAKIVRAIGNPADRFAEDKLRILRAVRFAAQLDFTLHGDTSEAIAALASQLIVVSAERIANELRLILRGARRAAGLNLLSTLGLLDVILPELVSQADDPRVWGEILQCLEAIPGQDDAFEITLAIAFGRVAENPCEAVACWQAAAQRLKLANREIQLVTWLIENFPALADAQHRSWPTIQPLLIHENIGTMIRLLQATCVVRPQSVSAIDFCQQKLRLPPLELNPVPLLTGDDLIALGVPQGAIYAQVLQNVRAAQLTHKIEDHQAAVAWAKSMVDRQYVDDTDQ